VTREKKPRCGHVLTKGKHEGEPCVRPLDHPGRHYSAATTARNAADHRERYRTEPAERERQKARKTDPGYREKQSAYHRERYRTEPEYRKRGRVYRRKYEASAKGWATTRKYALRGERERIQQQLEDLRREEAECLKSLATAMQTKSDEPALSS
jgi:hypothetical protein